MKRQLFLILVIACSACNSDSRPENVLPPEKMQEVLLDITRADELVDLSAITDSTYRGNGKRYALYDSVFRFHAVSKVQYEQSREWYQARPDLLKPLLETVRDKADTSKRRTPSRKLKPA